MLAHHNSVALHLVPRVTLLCFMLLKYKKATQLTCHSKEIGKQLVLLFFFWKMQVKEEPSLQACSFESVLPAVWDGPVRWL